MTVRGYFVLREWVIVFRNHFRCCALSATAELNV